MSILYGIASSLSGTNARLKLCYVTSALQPYERELYLDLERIEGPICQGWSSFDWAQLIGMTKTVAVPGQRASTLKEQLYITVSKPDGTFLLCHFQNFGNTYKRVASADTLDILRTMSCN